MCYNVGNCDAFVYQFLPGPLIYLITAKFSIKFLNVEKMENVTILAILLINNVNFLNVLMHNNEKFFERIATSVLEDCCLHLVIKYITYR